MPRDAEVTQRAGSRRALTGLAEAACEALLPHFEPAFGTDRHDRTLAGQPRTRRRSSTSGTGPWPTIADTRRFLLTSWTQHPIQEVQGQLLGMRQAPANTWIHLRQPVLKGAVAPQDLLPARTAAELAALVTTPAPDGSATPPLVGRMALNVRSTARPIPKRHKSMTAASRRVTRSTTSS